MTLEFREFPVAREGLLLAIPLCILTVILAFLLPGYLTLVLILINLFLLYFFRNPARTIPGDEGVIVAPADGKVIYVGESIEDQFLGEKSHKISIFMSIFNVHVNRIPTSGTIIDLCYRKGKFFSANVNEASSLNEQNALLLETEGKRKILFVQIAGLIARRIICWIKNGDNVIKGERFGLICFGSRVDTFLPLDTTITVKVGQRVKAGETIVGYLP
ncbi:MAG: phosphatidylserine decarboxylase family protein [Pseudomonadota bacterium]